MPHEKALVVGGCGFVGFHIVNALVQDLTWSSVHVMSRNPSRNQVQDAHYHAANVSSRQQVQQVISEVRPTLIIHAASPLGSGNSSKPREHQETNVQGTRNLLECAMSSGTVKAFIYTSSADVIQGSSQELATEDAPLYTANSRTTTYAKTKAMADQAVLDANGMGGLLTVCLRPAVVYGERDSQMIPGTLQALKEGRQRYQIGDNKSLFDVTSATNLAVAHILAAKALVSGSDEKTQRIAGEAFFITDDKPIPFWSFERKIWRAAGDQTTEKEVIEIPSWLMLNFASLVEWIFWAFTIGLKRPEVYTRQTMGYTCLPRTYSIEKARARLGYTPLDDRDEQIQKGVMWELRQREEAR